MIKQFAFGFAIVASGLALKDHLTGVTTALPVAICILGIIPILWGMSVLGYNLPGRHRLRDRIFRTLNLRSDEEVLDACGGPRFFFLEAARRLDKGGRASG